MNPTALTIAQARGALRDGRLTALALTDAVLARIATLDARTGAYITVAAEQARAQAEAADRRIADGRAAALTGIPLAVKDVICTAGVRTTCGSKILHNFVPPYDAHVIRRLTDAGAVILGKTNMDEFAMGSSTENSAFHPTRNPWDPTRIPGGSSGGSAAAVAADLCLGALGSDTGGSIRQPAGHCGIVGVKPTYGRVSRYGLVAYASSLDQIGPMTKCVGDAALMLNALCGHDPADSTSATAAVPDFTTFLTDGLEGVTIGVPRAYLAGEGLDPEVAAAVEAALGHLTGLGARCVDITLPPTDQVLAAYYVIASSEASSNLARYDGVRFGLRDTGAGDLMEMYRRSRSSGFGPEVQRRILVGTYSLSAGYYDAYYGKASQVRTLVREAFGRAFDACDVVALPVAPTPAFRLGEKVDDPLTMYLSDMFTLAANLAGIPGLALPCGFTGTGLPIGLQLLAGHFNEGALLTVGHNYESTTEHHRRRPPLEI